MDQKQSYTDTRELNCSCGFLGTSPTATVPSGHAAGFDTSILGQTGNLVEYHHPVLHGMRIRQMAVSCLCWLALCLSSVLSTHHFMAQRKPARPYHSLRSLLASPNFFLAPWCSDCPSCITPFWTFLCFCSSFSVGDAEKVIH